MCAYSTGDVLHYTDTYGDDSRPVDVWLLVVDAKAAKQVVLLKGGFNVRNVLGERLSIANGTDFADWDARRVVPPEEWPDEVCVGVARFHIGGSVHGDR